MHTEGNPFEGIVPLADPLVWRTGQQMWDSFGQPELDSLLDDPLGWLKETAKLFCGGMLLLALLVGNPSTAKAGILLDPKTGTYWVTKDTRALEKVVPPDPPDHDVLATTQRMRRFRYLYFGLGGEKGSVEYAPVTGTVFGGDEAKGSGVVGEVGLEFTGLEQPNPFNVEFRGQFGNGPKQTSTHLMWWLGYPMGYLLAGDQSVPIRLDLGIGYGGVSFEQGGGKVLKAGGFRVEEVAAGTTRGSVAGLMFGAKTAWFGKANMFRLAWYYVGQSNAKTGIVDTVNLAGDSIADRDVEVDGRSNEIRFDWVHRNDRAIERDDFLSGYGISLVHRITRLDEGLVEKDFFSGQVIVPAQKVSQTMVLFTVGRCR